MRGTITAKVGWESATIALLDTSESCRQGKITTTRATLDSMIGQATLYPYCCEKSTAEWYVSFEDGLIATVYDYNYDLGLVNPPPADMEYRWHIGGNSSEAVQRIAAILTNEDGTAAYKDLESDY
jgi:hypothetical protein